MKITGAKFYTVFILMVVAALVWTIIDAKLIYHPPEMEVLALLPPTEVPVWEASDSAQLADSQRRIGSEVSAVAYLVMDIPSRTVLLEKNADLSLPPASTTKLMTALTALKLYDLDEVVEVSTKAAEENDGGGLFPQEKMTVANLLVGLLVSSANDSAFALAEHAPGGETQFLQEMNQNAQALHLTHTMYQNPAGYDDPANTMSARDLVFVSLEAIKQPELFKWMGLQNVTVYNTDATIRHILFTTNELLGAEPRLIAGKTGTTDLAGQVLVSIINHESHPLLIVIMGSQDRYADTQRILQWVTNNVGWETPEN